jgi:hypothetical protein
VHFFKKEYFFMKFELCQVKYYYLESKLTIIPDNISDKITYLDFPFDLENLNGEKLIKNIETYQFYL